MGAELIATACDRCCRKVGFPVPGCSLLAGAGLTIRIKGCGGFSRPDGSFWHFRDIARSRMNFRFRRKSGRAADITGMTESDPACVKTHTIAKCRKYNSPTRYRTSCAQHDSTPWCAISSRCFYVRGGRWSFRTAKTRTGHRPSRNPAAQRDLILANTVCCHEVPGWGSRCNSID